MRFVDALLPALELAVERCRTLVNEPAPAPVAKPKRARSTEPEKPEALAQAIVRIQVDRLRPEERAALRFIREHGPMTMKRFIRTYKLKPSARKRILEDLDRFGLVAGYYDGNGWSIIHATERAGPMLDDEPIK